MATTPEQRRFPRLPVPPLLGGPGVALQMRLLDLSLGGARVEHRYPLPDRQLCYLDLSPDLGGGWLRGEVVWSRVARRSEGAEGKEATYYQSGLRFTMLTLGQQERLRAALAILETSPKG